MARRRAAAGAILMTPPVFAEAMIGATIALLVGCASGGWARQPRRSLAARVEGDVAGAGHTAAALVLIMLMWTDRSF